MVAENPFRKLHGFIQSSKQNVCISSIPVVQQQSLARPLPPLAPSTDPPFLRSFLERPCLTVTIIWFWQRSLQVSIASFTVRDLFYVWVMGCCTVNLPAGEDYISDVIIVISSSEAAWETINPSSPYCYTQLQIFATQPFLVSSLVDARGQFLP